MDKNAKAVLEAEDRRRVALVALDIPVLDALFADDLVHIHSTALVHNKAQLLRYIEERRAYIRIDRGPLAVRIAGDIAVMTGTLVNHMRADGKEFKLSGMVTQVLRREAGAWRFINFQLTLGGS
jgi:ketosteroid isomerase-like protein